MTCNYPKTDGNVAKKSARTVLMCAVQAAKSTPIPPTTIADRRSNRRYKNLIRSHLPAHHSQSAEKPRSEHEYRARFRDNGISLT